jgi:Uma2 family endonuclease
MAIADIVPKRKYTVEEYFELDNNSEIRHEFYEGEVFAMAGTTRNHNRLAKKITRLLDDAFEEKGCEAIMQSVKLEAINDKYYPYPDVMLVCDPTDDNSYVIKNPVLIVEVLSNSTGEYDRTFKLRRYRNIPSLDYYLLVSQYEVFVELYSRTKESQMWSYSSYENLNDIVDFSTLGYQLSLKKLYDNIIFENKA